ncbi:double-strand break repair protein MRE11 [Leptopilina heterotoma]|uniref:double-strand break repair protein MRE11 n=1 Tax=Leptopilina heterotoma TaxID=63436 RepID=UPI001CA8021D|nr:double-strand break repair protein MRE11 [Leptopilina heterotoma]
MSDEEDNQDLRNDENFDPEDTFKILLATDCHLGYERSTRRDQQDDSLITFEEILQIAVENEVDFILLGGDLFHETKPPQDIMAKCVALIKKYCMGTRDIKIQMLTDPELIFKDSSNKMVNFEDPNLNISIPVFSIHGNHDDPSSGATGSLDLLSETGLVNYFGKWTNLEKVEIPPLILKKGNTYISLYGLSYINDKRLARLMRDGNFKMLRATEIPESFNIFVLHQNRVCHGLVNALTYVKQEKLPKFLNFVMWGHEHECRITPEEFEANPKYFISQPGSSVATSLSEGEAVTKHVGILSVHKTDFKLKKIKLKTVRPFVFDNVYVSKDMPELANKSQELWPDLILKYVRDFVEHEMMPRAANLLTGHPDQPTLPLIRVRVHINDDSQRFENNKISQIFCEDVANPMDIILFVKDLRKMGCVNDKMGNLPIKFFEFDDIYDEKQWNKTVQDGICKYFAEDQNIDKLSVFTVTDLNDALTRFTDQCDTNAFETLVKDQKQSIIEHLSKSDIDFNDDKNIFDKLAEFQRNRLMNNEENEEFLRLREEAAKRRKEKEESGNSRRTGDNDEEMDEKVANVPAKGRGRGRGRGAKGKSPKAIVISDDEEVGEEEDEPRPAKGRGKARGKARAKATTTTTTRKPRGRTTTTTTSATSGSNSLRNFLDITTSRHSSKPSRADADDDEFIDSD